ncbi:serine/threonine-protein kinase [Pontiella sulfatireligans]|uniref:Serine/threonine-protein kinase PknD n=1 Tax=Pontiella sulfatireligans TaxID=2750658 RepID=A0A6C2UCV7_9BACT|nr:serine/threonine-protein kinase [Pontiella sulfatireligans]VGO17980.1 Serine/threonine-protein kinase PknD [Pontiella sulfatireligans]
MNESRQAGAGEWDATLTLWRQSIPDGGTAEDSIRAAHDTFPPTCSTNPHFRTLEPAAGSVPDFELGKQLGSGGMGVIYSANQTAFNREVAVKMVKPARKGSATAADALMAEAVVTGHLEHPNVVPVYDLGVDADGNLFYAMKEVQGLPWSKLMAKKTLDENLDILLRVSDTVSFAHARGILHRDLKPHNIMLGEFGETMVMDWGASCAFGGAQETGAMRAGSSFCGTPAYMSPEMARGDANRQGQASDVYLLGAILYQIVAGHPPRREKDPVHCISLASENFIEPVEGDGELLRIALQAMASIPADRHPDAKGFQQAIRDYRSHSESLRVLENAKANLFQAKQEHDYDLFSQAVFGFREAKALWPENPDAERLRIEAALEYARCAFGNSDYELAQSLLDPADPVHCELLEIIAKALRERDAHKRRSRRLLFTARLLIVLLLLVFAVAYFLIRGEHRKNLANLIAAHYGEQNHEATIAAFWEFHDRYSMDDLSHDTLLDVRVAAHMNPWCGAIETDIENPLKIMPGVEDGCVWVVGKKEMKKVRLDPDAGFDSATVASIHDFKFGKRLPPGKIVETVSMPFELASGEAVHESPDGTLWAGSGSLVCHRTAKGWEEVLDVALLDIPPLAADFEVDNLKRDEFQTWMELEGRGLPITGIIANRNQDRVAAVLGAGTLCWIDVINKKCVGWYYADMDFPLEGWESSQLFRKRTEPLLLFSPEEKWLLFCEGGLQTVVYAFELPVFSRKKYFVCSLRPCMDLAFPTEQRCWGLLDHGRLVFSPTTSALFRYWGEYYPWEPIQWSVSDDYGKRRLPSGNWKAAALSPDGSECFVIDDEDFLFAGSTLEGTGFDLRMKIENREWVDCETGQDGHGLALSDDGRLHAYNLHRHAIAVLELGGAVVDVCGGHHPDHCFAIIEKPHGKNDVVEITGIRSAAPQARVMASNCDFARVSCDPKGRWLAVLGTQECQVLDLKTGHVAAALKPGIGSICPVAFDAAGEYLICGGDWSYGTRTFKTGNWKVADQTDGGRAQVVIHQGRIIENKKYGLRSRLMGQTNLLWKASSGCSSLSVMPFTDPVSGQKSFWNQDWYDGFEVFDASNGKYDAGVQEYWKRKEIGAPVFNEGGAHALLPLGTGQLEMILKSDLYPLFDSRSMARKAGKAVYNSDASMALMKYAGGLALMNLRGPLSPRPMEESKKHYVSQNGLGLWPYSSWTTAARQIQTAVDVAIAGDEVVLDRGLFQINKSVSIREAIALRGRYGADSTVIDAGGSSTVVELRSVTDPCRIDGITLTGGNGWGGGIVCRDCRNVVISDCVISNNAGSTGGGINVVREYALKTGISDNSLRADGKAVPKDFGLIVVSNCLVQSNCSVGSGGGINFDGKEHVNGRLLIIDSDISGNVSGSSGGGAGIGNPSAGDQVDVAGCRIIGNKAQKTGGAVLAAGRAGGCTVSNTVFSGNSSGKGKDVVGAKLIGCTFEP